MSRLTNPCRHCKKEVSFEDQDVVVIYHRSATTGAFYFHEDCFIQIAGTEFMPVPHKVLQDQEVEEKTRMLDLTGQLMWPFSGSIING